MFYLFLISCPSLLNDTVNQLNYWEIVSEKTAMVPCSAVLLPVFIYILKVEGGWNLSASFPVDSIGEYTLRLTRRVDVNKLRHISTRRSSEYDVAIPHMEVRWRRGILMYSAACTIDRPIFRPRIEHRLL